MADRLLPPVLKPNFAPLTKSPVNAAVGELMKVLRSRNRQEVHAIAEAFGGLSQTYVRAIEAGQRALPAYAVVGLVERLGMTWASASALVGLAGFMDLARKEKEYLPEKVLALASRLRESQPQFREFLDGVTEMVTSNVRPVPAERKSDTGARSSEWTERAQAVSAQLERCINKCDGSSQRGGLRSPVTLNPVFEDLVEGLVDQLAMFPPHVNTAAIQRWENKNSDRILSLRACVSGAETLIGSSSGFDWKFVRKSPSSIQILVRGTSPEELREIEKKFLAALVRPGRGKSERHEFVKSDLSRRVTVRPPEELEPDCSRALVFDFTTRSRAVAGAPTSDAIRAFSNAWLYELQPEAEARQGSPRWIGFLMDTDPLRGYAVAMNNEHVREWLDIFDRVKPQATGASSRPTRPTKGAARLPRS